jgi:DNA-binding MarR family transcriptional regulator
MQLLQRGSNIERQSGQLLGYLDALFRRLVVQRQPADDPMRECSREEIRAMMVLRSSGRSIMTDFAAELGVPLSTATHTIDRLVLKGLVMRLRSEKDRRVVQVEMSRQGQALQTILRARHQAMARSWLAPLSPGERETFLELMAKIAENAKPDAAVVSDNAATARRMSMGSETRNESLR